MQLLNQNLAIDSSDWISTKAVAVLHDEVQCRINCKGLKHRPGTDRWKFKNYFWMDKKERQNGQNAFWLQVRALKGRNPASADSMKNTG